MIGSNWYWGGLGFAWVCWLIWVISTRKGKGR